MAQQRRGGGSRGSSRGSSRSGSAFRPPELRGTLGTLINTALSQAGNIRDAIERGAREGRARLDDARANRQRHDALAELGEIVLDLIRRGEIDLGELPEAEDIIRTLDELDGELDGDHPTNEPVAPRASSRKRFDDRRDDGTVSSSRPWTPQKPAGPARVWRPTADETPEPPTPTAPPSREPKRLPNNPSRKGGIAFDDEDLAEYMHPDDVPPKDGDT